MSVQRSRSIENERSKDLAREIIARGQQDADLRRIQAERLLAEITVSSVDRGFRSTSQTTADQATQAAFLEGVDIDRIKFRASVEAGEVRLQGEIAKANQRNREIDELFQSIQFGFQAATTFGAFAAATVPTTPTPVSLGPASLPSTQRPTQILGPTSFRSSRFS